MTLAERFSPVLVTGASGFVGTNLVHRLVREGYEVHVLLRDTARSWRLDGMCDQLHVHRADLLDAPAVQAAVAAVRPRLVQHLAAYGAYESQADASLILATNVLGTYHLLEASSRAGVKLFISTGSSSEYGFKSEAMVETDRLEPNSFYAVAKAAQSHLCRLMSRRTEMAVVNFRLFSVYGPWEEPSRLIPTVIRRARAAQPLQMTTPETARDFIYVKDVVRALLDLDRLAELSGEIFNLGTGMQSTLSDVVALVQQLVGSASEVRWGGMPARHWDANRWFADISKTRRRLGWSPRYTLEQGLAEMAAWMAEVGDDYGEHGLRRGAAPPGDERHAAPVDHRAVA